MDLTSAVLRLASLAQVTRLEVFRLLVRAEPNGISAGKVAQELNVPQNTMSAHLAILTRAGLVSSKRRGRSIIYRADLSALQKLMLFMIEDCCGGRIDLCAGLVESLTPHCRPPARSKRKLVTLKSKVAR